MKIGQKIGMLQILTSNMGVSSKVLLKFKVQNLQDGYKKMAKPSPWKKPGLFICSSLLLPLHYRDSLGSFPLQSAMF